MKFSIIPGTPAFILISLALLVQCCNNTRETPPVAGFIVSSQYADTIAVLEFDASKSYDEEDPLLALTFRWDWENDGTWDTPVSRNPRNSHRYRQNGLYQPVLEVLDQDGLADTCAMPIRITDVRKDSLITDSRDGRNYHVTLIGDVWWMSENLDYGMMIPSSIYQTDNGTTEKYYFEDSDSIGALFGGLYSWDEAMDYRTNPGSQGICPPGWQIPSGPYVSALWDLVSFPYPDHKSYLGKGGYLGIDLVKSGSFDLDYPQQFDNLLGAFWMSQQKKVNGIAVPFYFIYTNVLYINNPDNNPPGEFSAISVRCIKPVISSR